MLTLNQKKIYNYIISNGRIDNKECQTLCSVKKRQASSELKKMIDNNILKKIGTRGRGTFYVLNE